MNRKITFRAIEHSDDIEKEVHMHIDKMEKFFKPEQGPTNVEVVIESHRDKQFFIVEFRIQTPHYHIIATEEGENISSLINKATQKAIQEIIEEKGKFQTKRDHIQNKE